LEKITLTLIASAPAVLQISHLQKQYGPITAVDDLSLTVRRGEIYGFLGPNGAGKTTTIRMLMGLIKPSHGYIRLFDEPLLKNRAALLARVGSLIESPSAYSHLTGRQNLEITRRMIAAPAARMDAVLEQVGLRDAAHRIVREYSLGMKGRLAIASALLGSPELLILDEPTNGLDPAGIREMRDFLRRLPEQGVTVLVSSHLLSEIEQMATTVGIIAAGKMRFEGKLETLRARFPSKLRVCVSDWQRASDLMQAFASEERPKENLGKEKLGEEKSGELILNALPEQAASVNKTLVTAGIDVSHLEVTRPSLERIFLDLVEGVK
jgi:lantibiotic transport system ATP-binding protein